MGLVVDYDVRTGNRVFEVGDELDAVLAADINENHTLIALGGPQKIVRVFATADGSQVYEIHKHTDWIYALEFSPDGVLLATADLALEVAFTHDARVVDGDWTGDIRMWDAADGEQVATLTANPPPEPAPETATTEPADARPAAEEAAQEKSS